MATVQQVFNLVNNITKEMGGEIPLLNEDYTNVVDVGNAVFNNTSMDNYVKKLINQVGRMVFVDRAYKGTLPDILRDSWEYGAVLEKVQVDMLEANENESWDLVDGQSYDENIFTQPKVSVKFYNKKTTFEIPISITDKQVKESFQNGQQLNAFINMIYVAVEKSMTSKIDGLIMTAVRTLMGEIIAKKETNKIQAVDVLKFYNDLHPTAKITKEQAIFEPEFLRTTAYKIKLDRERMKKLGTSFNLGKKYRFTPAELNHTVLLSDFAKAMEVYLYNANGQVNTDSIKLSDYETVPFWQGQGSEYSLKDISSIDIKLPDGHGTVKQDYILGMTFDRDAIMVCNENRRTTSKYNNKAEFTNNWFKVDCSMFVDTDEQAIVYYLGDNPVAV